MSSASDIHAVALVGLVGVTTSLVVTRPLLTLEAARDRVRIHTLADGRVSNLYTLKLINKDTRVITQGITGKTGQFHTRMCREYANGKNCFVAGVNPKKAGEDFEGIPIFGTVADAKKSTGATVSVIQSAADSE